MKTYEAEIDELCKHLEQVILLATGGFPSGNNTASIRRIKAAMQLRGLARKAMALMHEITTEPEPKEYKHPFVMIDGEGFTCGDGMFRPGY